MIHLLSSSTHFHLIFIFLNPQLSTTFINTFSWFQSDLILFHNTGPTCRFHCGIYTNFYLFFTFAYLTSYMTSILNSALSLSVYIIFLFSVLLLVQEITAFHIYTNSHSNTHTLIWTSKLKKWRRCDRSSVVECGEAVPTAHKDSEIQMGHAGDLNC